MLRSLLYLTNVCPSVSGFTAYANTKVGACSGKEFSTTTHWQFKNKICRYLYIFWIKSLLEIAIRARSATLNFGALPEKEIPG
jgi:hypothetical protein